MEIKFLLDTRLFSEKYIRTGINDTFIRAIKRFEQPHKELLDFNENIHVDEIPEIVDSMMRKGITQFTISSSQINNSVLADFERYGAKIVGTTTVNATYPSHIGGEMAQIPALLMKITSRKLIYGGLNSSARYLRADLSKISDEYIRRCFERNRLNAEALRNKIITAVETEGICLVTWPGKSYKLASIEWRRALPQYRFTLEKYGCTIEKN